MAEVLEKEKELLKVKLDEFDARYSELETQISDPAISSDTPKIIALSKEQGKLRSLVTKYREYKKIVSDIEQSQHIIADASAEAELKEMAQQDISQLKTKKDALLIELRDMLVMADDVGIGSCIMEIRAGTGGEEAALFARDLYNMYTKYAEDKHWAVELLDFSPTDRGGFREVIFSVKGAGAWAHLGYEGGGHRVQRVPETEAQGRVHTSAATVAVLAEPEEVEGPQFFNPEWL
jgi:peptide chain release factor 1